MNNQREKMIRQLIDSLPKTKNMTVPVSELKELFEVALSLALELKQEKDKTNILELQVSKLSSSPRIVYRKDK